jgi:hypothetical protein
MQPRPPFDRALLIPMAVGLVSILGLVWILLTSDLSETIFPPTAVPTAISLDDNPGEAELQITPPTPSILEETPSTTETSPVSYPGPSAETPPATSTVATSIPLTETRPVPSATPTPDQLLPVGKHDDTDPNIEYDRYWVTLKNPSTANAYKGTLHFSKSMGSEISFHFIGQRFHIGYQRGRSFGIVTVLIDGQPYSFHEQAFDLIWRSPQLSAGVHSVKIIHESGEAVNLDYVEILD